MSQRRPREPGRVWVTPPSPDLQCSVCTDIFVDPIALLCGHTFCRACAVRWFNAPAKRCPVARCPASANSQPATLPSAYTVKNLAEALRVYCRYGLREDERGEWVPDAAGCQAQLCRADVAAHEAACEHALEACPFAGCGVQRRRRDADAHDAEAAVAHARGERDARLALEASERDARLKLEAQMHDLNAAANARLAALEARFVAAVVPGAAGGSVAPRAVTGATRRATLQGHSDSVCCCAWSPDGATLVSASEDKTLKLWDATTHACTANLNGHIDSVYGCSWSPDGRTIASCSADQTVKLWDAETHSCEASLGHVRSVYACAWSPDGRSLASAAGIRLNIWDVTTRSRIASFTNTDAGANLFFCAWSPDGSVVLLCGQSGTVKLRDVATRSFTATLTSHTQSVEWCTWSSDGSRFVTASDDKTLKLWSAAAPFDPTATLWGHTDGVVSCAWSPDGRTIASGSHDKTLKLWDASTASCIATLENADCVNACAWSPDGRTLASGCGDGMVTLWDVQRS